MIIAPPCWTYLTAWLERAVLATTIALNWGQSWVGTMFVSFAVGVHLLGIICFLVVGVVLFVGVVVVAVSAALREVLAPCFRPHRSTS